MVEKMKPASARRTPLEKTLTMNTAVALSTSIHPLNFPNIFYPADSAMFSLEGIQVIPLNACLASGDSQREVIFFISVREVYEAERINWAKRVKKFQGRDFITATSSHFSEPVEIFDPAPCDENNHQLLATCG